MVACEVSQRHPTEGLRCPRCDSADTKFCYFNNYNTSQPRHFCKSCKRYWTAGGSLRNVPVGGGLRKNKKSKPLNQVKDMVSSSSSDEFLQKSSAPAMVPYSGLQLDSPMPLSFAPPLFMAAPGLSREVAGDGTSANPFAFGSLNTNYGYLAEERINSYATSVDPSLVGPMSARRQAHFQSDYAQMLPEVLQQQWNGGLHVPRACAGADQAQSHSGCVSEVPSEASQASFEVIKDSHTSKAADWHACHSDQMQAPEDRLYKRQRDESVDFSAAIGQASVNEQFIAQKQGNVMEEAGHVEDNQVRDVSSTEEDDELGNVVNVRYPYDWEQVSEVLFGGQTDFYQLSGY